MSSYVCVISRFRVKDKMPAICVGLAECSVAGKVGNNKLRSLTVYVLLQYCLANSNNGMTRPKAK